MKLKAKLKIVKLTFSMKKIERKVLKYNLRIETLSRILDLHKLTMKTKMIILKKYTAKHKLVQSQNKIGKRQTKFNLSKNSIRE
jgi:Mg2+ and Co2+ transporter CorA